MEAINLTNETSYCDADNVATNFINFTDPQVAANAMYNPAEKLLIVGLVLFISAFGFIGNGAFLHMYYILPEARVSLSTFLAHLAVCDLFYLLSVNIWYGLILYENSINFAMPVYTSFGCAMYKISIDWWYYTSLGLVTLITIERYIAVCHPLKHRIMNSTRRTYKLIAGVWIGALIVTLSEVPKYVKLNTYCVLWPADVDYNLSPQNINTCEPLNEVADIYGSSSVLTAFVVSLSINVVLFVKITRAMKRSLALQTFEKTQSEITRTLIANGTIFFLCPLPYRVQVMDDILDLAVNESFIEWEFESLFLTIGRAFLLLNSIINPYVYCNCSLYRTFVKRTILKRCCRKDLSEGFNSEMSTSQMVRVSTVHNELSTV